jgi:hypothetical protein
MSSNPEKDINPEQIRFEISQLEKMRAQIMSDMESMRAQETNLKARFHAADADDRFTSLL